MPCTDQPDDDRPTILDLPPAHDTVGPRRIPSQMLRLWGRWLEQERRPELPRVYQLSDLRAAYRGLPR